MPILPTVDLPYVRPTTPEKKLTDQELAAKSQSNKEIGESKDRILGGQDDVADVKNAFTNSPSSEGIVEAASRRLPGKRRADIPVPNSVIQTLFKTVLSSTVKHTAKKSNMEISKETDTEFFYKPGLIQNASLTKDESDLIHNIGPHRPNDQ